MLTSYALVAVYLLGVNGMTYLLFGYDKAAAEDGGRRVREATLLNVAMLGGTPAAYLASAQFRHKTHKMPFRRNLHGIAALQALMLLTAAGYQMFGP